MKLEKNLNRQKSEGSAGVKLIKRFLFAAAAAVFLTGCAPSQGAEPAAQSEEQAASLEKTSAEGMSITSEAAGAEQGSNEGSGTAKSAEAVMDQEQGKVRIVIPTVYEDIKTQEEADEIRERNGYESATLEEDGSLTIVMSRSQYEEMIAQFKESVDKGISEIVHSGSDSIIEKIEYNDDYSVFTVTVSSDELGIIERSAAGELIMYGTLYHIYTGSDTDHISVDFVDSGSGEIIESADSGSLDSAY